MALGAAVKLALAGLLAVAATVPDLVQAKSQANPPDTSISAIIQLAELPRQGRETYEAIRQGGPFPHDKDGAVFGNRERLLPAGKRGYYREYTVATPGQRDRGARRIVCGGPAKSPDTCYYTPDHYASFRKIVREPQ